MIDGTEELPLFQPHLKGAPMSIVNSPRTNFIQQLDKAMQQVNTIKTPIKGTGQRFTKFDLLSIPTNECDEKSKSPKDKNKKSVFQAAVVNLNLNEYSLY